MLVQTAEKVSLKLLQTAAVAKMQMFHMRASTHITRCFLKVPCLSKKPFSKSFSTRCLQLPAKTGLFFLIAFFFIFPMFVVERLRW